MVTDFHVPMLKNDDSIRWIHLEHELMKIEDVFKVSTTI